MWLADAINLAGGGTTRELKRSREIPDCSLCSLPFLGETNITFKQLHHEMHIEPPTSSKSWNVERKVGGALGRRPEWLNIKRKWEAPWAATCSRERYRPAVAA